MLCSAPGWWEFHRLSRWATEQCFMVLQWSVVGSTGLTRVVKAGMPRMNGPTAQCYWSSQSQTSWRRARCVPSLQMSWNELDKHMPPSILGFISSIFPCSLNPQNQLDHQRTSLCWVSSRANHQSGRSLCARCVWTMGTQRTKAWTLVWYKPKAPKPHQSCQLLTSSHCTYSRKCCLF